MDLAGMVAVEVRANLGPLEAGLTQAQQKLLELDRRLQRQSVGGQDPLGARAGFTRLRQEIERAIPAVASVSSAMDRFVGPLGRVEGGSARVGTAIGLMAAGVVAATAGLVAAAVKTAAWADRLVDLSVQAGISAEKIQVLRFVAVEAGAGAEEMDRAIVRLTRSIGEAATGQGALADLMRKHKIAITEANGATRNTADILADIADRIANAKDASEAMRLSFVAFGRELGSKMVIALQGGSKAFKEAEERAKQLGLVVSNDMAKRLADANDQLAKSWYIIKQQLIIALADAVPVVELLARALAGLARFARESVDIFKQLLGLMPRSIDTWEKHIRARLSETGAPGPGGMIVAPPSPQERALLEEQLRELERFKRAAESAAKSAEDARTRPGGGLPIDPQKAGEVLKIIEKLESETKQLDAQLSNGPNLAGWVQLEAELKKAGASQDYLNRASIIYWDNVRKRGAVALQEFARENDRLRQIIDAELTGREDLVKVLQYELQLRQSLGDKAEDFHAEEIRRLAEERVALEQRQERIKTFQSEIARATDSIGNAIEQTFMAAFDNTGDMMLKLRDIWRSVITDMLSMAARFVLINPLKNELFGTNLPTLTNLGGSPFGGVGSTGSILSGNGPGGILGSVGRLLSSPGGSMGGSLFGYPLFGQALSADQIATAQAGANALGTTLPPNFGMPGIVNVAGGALGGALAGLGIGSLVGGLIPGMNQENSQIGGGIGGAIGAAIGSFIPGIGTLLGGLLGGAAGSFLGGIFGPGKSVGPNSGAGLDFNRVTGRVFVQGAGADNGGNLAAGRSFGEGLAEAMNRTMDQIGATFVRAGGLAARIFGDRFEVGLGLGTMASGTDPEQVVEQALFKMLKGGDFFMGMGEDVTKAIRNSVAKDLEGLLEDINFAKNIRDIASALEAAGDALKAVEKNTREAVQSQIDEITKFIDKAKQLGFVTEANAALPVLIDQLFKFGQEQEEVTQTQRALAALGAAFETVRKNATELGLSEAFIAQKQVEALNTLRTGFNEGIAQQILNITDPLTAALQEFDKMAARRVEDARRLGADLVAVERLNALERQRVLEQFGQTSLQRFLEELTFGQLSGQSPLTSLEGVRASFMAAAAQGNRTRIEELGRQLVTLSRSAYASGPQFQSDLEYVRGVVASFVDGTNNPIVGAINDFANENIRLTTLMAQELGVMRAQLTEQSTQIAVLSSTIERLVRGAA